MALTFPISHQADSEGRSSLNLFECYGYFKTCINSYLNDYNNWLTVFKFDNPSSDAEEDEDHPDRYRWLGLQEELIQSWPEDLNFFNNPEDIPDGDPAVQWYGTVSFLPDLEKGHSMQSSRLWNTVRNNLMLFFVRNGHIKYPQYSVNATTIYKRSDNSHDTILDADPNDDIIEQSDGLIKSDHFEPYYRDSLNIDPIFFDKNHLSTNFYLLQQKVNNILEDIAPLSLMDSSGYMDLISHGEGRLGTIAYINRLYAYCYLLKYVGHYVISGEPVSPYKIQGDIGSSESTAEDLITDCASAKDFLASEKAQEYDNNHEIITESITVTTAYIDGDTDPTSPFLAYQEVDQRGNGGVSFPDHQGLSNTLIKKVCYGSAVDEDQFVFNFENPDYGTLSFNTILGYVTDDNIGDKEFLQYSLEAGSWDLLNHLPCSDGEDSLIPDVSSHQVHYVYFTSTTITPEFPFPPA